MRKFSFKNPLKQQQFRRGASAVAAAAAAARPLVEPLERREMFSITTVVSNDVLEISSGNGDTVTIDHAGTSTLVNGVAFPDAQFSTMKLHVGSLFGSGNNVNVRAVTKALSIDSPAGIDDLVIGGKPGLGAQGIQEEVTVSGMEAFTNITVDDSQNPSPRTWRTESGSGRVEVYGVGPKRLVFDDHGFDDLVLLGGSGGNTFDVNNTPVWGGLFDIRLIGLRLSSGTGNDTVNVRRASNFTTFLQGQSGHDTVNLGNNGSMAAITAKVQVRNDFGLTTLNVDASADAAPKNVKMGRYDINGAPEASEYLMSGLSPNSINLFDFNVDVFNVKAGGGGNTFTVEDTVASVKTSLSTGLGTDHVFVQRTNGPLEIHGFSGTDVVDVGNANNSQGIRGALLVDNAFSRSILNLHNSADTSGLAPAKIAFKVTDVTDLGISTGSRADVFFVQGTLGANTAIHAGGGDDRFRVGTTTNTINRIRTPLLLDGEGGTDFVSIFDQGSTTPHTYTNTATTVTRSSTNDPTVTITVKSIEALDVFKGLVTSTSPPLAKDLALSRKVRAGASATLTGRLEDADAADTLTLTVVWGDGSEPTVVTPGRDPFTLTHAYAAKGK
jgi:hypothetical protein